MKQITIHLDNGSPNGIKVIEVDNWDGRIIICPRANFKELANDWSKESQYPGVYLLVEGAMSPEPRAYIGKADKILTRIRLQLKEKNFWTQALIFTSKDGSLTNADIGHLEGRMIEKARDVGRVTLDNKQTPTSSQSRSVQAKIDGYLDHAQNILITLGIPYLRHIVPEDRSSELSQSEDNQSKKLDIFTFSGKGFEGTGILTDEGFVVRKESTGKLEPAPSLSKRLIGIRDSLKEKKKITVKGQVIVFKKDVVFGSSSAAASILAGGMRNGQDSWKDDKGLTLKQREQESISLADETVSKNKKRSKTKNSKIADLPKKSEKKPDSDPKKKVDVKRLIEIGKMKAGDKVWLKNKPEHKATLTKEGFCRFRKEVMSLSKYAKKIMDDKPINIYRNIVHGPTGDLLDKLRNQLK